MFEIVIKTKFSAAHKLVGYEGNCSNLHGHNFGIEIAICGKKLNKLGMIFDFREIKKIAEEVISKLDHKNLNEIKLFTRINPTSENIAKYIFQNIKSKLPKNIKPVWVKISESDNAYCVYKEK